MTNLRSVLFACNMNTVRSPMAACVFPSLIGGAIACDSAGLYRGWRDPMTEHILAEIDIEMGAMKAKTLGDVNLANFDLIIAMTPEVAGEIRRIVPNAPIEYWPVENPSLESGDSVAVLAAYRAVREDLIARMQERFGSNLDNDAKKP